MYREMEDEDKQSWAWDQPRPFTPTAPSGSGSQAKIQLFKPSCVRELHRVRWICCQSRAAAEQRRVGVGGTGGDTSWLPAQGRYRK